MTGPGPMSVGQMGGYNYLLTAAPDRLQAVSTPVRRGSYSARIKVPPGDNRAEYSAPKTLWRNGDDMWYATSILFPSASPLPPSGNWMVVSQWFAQDIPGGVSGGSPPLAIEVTPSGSLHLDVRGGVKASAGTPAPRNDEYPLAQATPAVWHDFLIHAHWSTGSDGLVQAWERTAGNSWTNVPQVTARGPNVFTVAGNVLPVYSEAGIYRSSIPQTQVVYNAGMWARTTRADAESFFSN